MTTETVGEILDGIWRFETLHPEWAEEEGGEEGWVPLVAWWAVRAPGGLVLVDPLVEDWSALDQLTDAEGGCAAIIRTCHWHQRSITESAGRYRVQVWAKPAPKQLSAPHPDRDISDREELFDRLVPFEMERDDEVALWLPPQGALIFGDAMVRRATGELMVCPDSWTQPVGGPARLRAVLRGLTELDVEDVLVSHGPLVLGDGLASLRTAIAT